MEVQIPSDMAKRIQAFIDADVGQTPMQVLEKGLKRLNTWSRLTGYRGMANGWSLECMLKDRREGLE